MTTSGKTGCLVERVWREKAGAVAVKLRERDQPAEEVRVRRCFPWSMPDRYISILDKDGKELALLASLDELDIASRAVVDAELRDKVFNPRITRLLDCKSEFGMLSLSAETDRGNVTFQVRTLDDIRMLSPRHMLLRDADGNSYEVTDVDALDRRTQRLLREHF